MQSTIIYALALAAMGSAKPIESSPTTLSTVGIPVGTPITCPKTYFPTEEECSQLCPKTCYYTSQPGTIDTPYYCDDCLVVKPSAKAVDPTPTATTSSGATTTSLLPVEPTDCFWTGWNDLEKCTEYCSGPCEADEGVFAYICRYCPN